MTSLLTILIGNLIPVVSVAFFGMSAFDLLILYWFENVVVGLFNLVKIIIAGLTRGIGEKLMVLFEAPFFTVHYGAFCFVHGLLITALFGQGGALAGFSDPLGQLFAAFLKDRTLLLNALILFGINLYLFITHWVMTKSWETTEPMKQMMEPYGRIIVIHVTILFGAFGLAIFGKPLFAVVLLALLKTGLETGLWHLGWGRRQAGVVS